MTFKKIIAEGCIKLIFEQHDSPDAVRAIITVLAVLACIVIPYFLGSINFAIIISKSKHSEDIRNYGSGNAGMTNMLRTYGKSAAALTLFGDALKAFVSAVIGYVLLGYSGAYLTGLFCILGHIFPLYYKFKGGKGVVTAAVSILMCNWLVFVVVFIVFVIIVSFTKYISLASVMCMMIYPFLLYRFEGPGPNVIIALVIAAIIIFKHKENIKRLRQGKESKISFTKTNKIDSKSSNSQKKED